MRVAFGEYQLDTKTRTLQREGRRIPVQSKAFDLLVYLAERRDEVVSSDELLDALWPGLHVTPAALSTAVQKARQAVGDDGARQTVLHTEHGKGFRFVAEVSDLSEPETAQPTPASFWTRVAAVVGIAALLLGVTLAWFLNRQATAPEPGPSLAVLPFENMSQGAAHEPFTNEIHDDILTHISRVMDLKVIARTTMERLDPNLSIQEIGNRLGVAAVLEGAVQRAGDRVQIGVQLIDCTTEAYLWRERYDRKYTAANIFAIQTEITTNIADALHVRLSLEERERLAKHPTENLAAYQAYLLGRQRLAKFTTGSIEEAIEYFQQAIELDPKLALAYVGLTQSYLAQAAYSGLPPDEMNARAQAVANKALELDDRLAETHVALGQVKWKTNDFEGAEAAFQRALALNSNSVMAYLAYSDLLGFELARYEEALALARKAVELDPLSVEAVERLAEDLNFLGRFDEALAWYERFLEIDPGYAWSYTQIGLHHSEISGRLDEAAVWWAKALALDPRSQFNLAFMAWLFIELGDPDRAEYWINRSIELGPEGVWPKYNSQALAVYRGDEAAALEHGRKVFAVWPHQSPVLTYLGATEAQAGRYIEARALYEDLFPELLTERDPKVDLGNYEAAIDLALILSRTGEREQADLLLDRSLQQIQRRPRLGRRGYMISDARIYALQGEKQKALSALREAIDQGWRTQWWYYFRHDPILESLHDEPEYQAMVAEIEADMAAQLARVREMERNGELEPIPEVSATTH
jgi:TolB-like protein/DNA-binding winged helix-turn-helix (wHTH) protein/Flp pilus assembly protein TadD